jgi:hypothetical protein
MKLIVESHSVISIRNLVEHVPTQFLFQRRTTIMLKLKVTSILPSRETYLPVMIMICAINVRQADNIQHITQQLRPLSS